MLTYRYHEKTVQDIFDLHGNERLNLEPGFQRKSIWTRKDRQKLINSLLAGYPLPSIFLYMRSGPGGVPVYDVIDGKQRIESLLGFAGRLRGQRFEVAAENGSESTDWNKLARTNERYKILNARLQVVQVEGEWEDIVDLFVKINSTGKKLDRAEISHAKYLNCDLLQTSNRFSKKWARYFVDHGILTSFQIDRYKHIELVCELLVSAHACSVIGKKDALDKAMQGTVALKGAGLRKAVQQSETALRFFRKLIGNPRETRFWKLSDFYSLVVVIQRLIREKLVLHDSVRNEMARRMLAGLSTGVDRISEKSRKLEFSRLEPGGEIFRSYLQTVKEGTDALANRRRRDQILYDLIAPIFEKKDERRLFNEEQRRILWNSAEQKRCPYCAPGKKLSWSDMTVDHIKPYAIGGRTELRNAQICCHRHNSKLGMKIKKPKKAA